MRAGANEFFTWPPRRRNIPRRDPPHRGAPRDRAGRTPGGDHAGVLRRQGRRRHDDAGRQLRRRTRAAEQALDDHRRPQTRARRSRAVPRRAAALQRCSTRSTTCTGSIASSCASWWSKHKSGLEILAGSDQFDRPGAADGGADRGGVPAAGAAVRVHRHRRRQPDQFVRGRGAVHRRQDVPGRQPGRAVGAQRAAAARARPPARRLRRAGARCCSTAPPEPYPIPPKQIEAALGHPIHHTFPSDYKTVSTALNSGVPLALAGDSRDRGAVRSVHARDCSIRTPTAPTPRRRKRSRLGFERLASIW